MPNIFSRLFKPTTEKRSYNDGYPDWQNPILGYLNLTSYNGYTARKAMNLSTFNRAIQVLSDSVAILPFENFTKKGNWYYRNYDDLYYLLNVQPNEDMGAFTFKKMLVQYIYLRGNAFVKLFRKSDNSISKLELLPSDNVQVILVDGHKKYVDTRTSEILDEADCIHIMGYSETGHIGISIVQTGALALGISYASETQALDYFEGNVTGILTPKTGTNISQEKALKAKENWINALSTKLGNSGSKIAVLDSSLEYQQINVSAKDSQLLESRKFNATTISQITGVPPNKLFDYTKASFANNEAANIAFLTDTLTPLLEKIENEFYRKIFNRVEYDTTDLRFNPDNLLRLDSVATANYLSSLFQIGGINSNEIRERIGANNPVSGGNRNFVQVNVQPLDNLISEQPKVVASGNTSTQQTNFIDNKLKA